MSKDSGIEYRWTKRGKTYYKGLVQMGAEYEGGGSELWSNILLWAGNAGVDKISRDQVFIEFGWTGLEGLRYFVDNGLIERIEE